MINPGEVWTTDFGMAAKVRPALLLTGSPADDELLSPMLHCIEQVSEVPRRIGSGDVGHVHQIIRFRIGTVTIGCLTIAGHGHFERSADRSHSGVAESPQPLHERG